MTESESTFKVLSRSKIVEIDKNRLIKKFNFVLRSSQQNINNTSNFINSETEHFSYFHHNSTKIENAPQRIIHNDYKSNILFTASVEHSTIENDKPILIDKTIKNEITSQNNSENINIQNNSMDSDESLNSLYKMSGINVNYNNEDKKSLSNHQRNKTGNKCRKNDTISSSPFVNRMFKDMNNESDVSKDYLNEERTDIRKEGQQRFCFIEDIRESVDCKEKKCYMKQIVTLNNKSFVNLSFMIGNCFIYAIATNKILKKKFTQALIDYYKDTIHQFTLIYKDYFEVSNVDIGIKKKTISLIFQCKLISKIIYQRCKLEYESSWNKNEIYTDIIFFDCLPRNSFPMQYIISESSKYKGFTTRYSYTSPLIMMEYNDSIILSIDIFGQFGYKAITFKEIECKQIPEESVYLFEKSLSKVEYKFDELRSSNFELFIHLWSDVHIEEPKVKCVRDFISFYKEYFTIKKVVCDFENVHVYKVRMKAKKVGIVKKNRYVSFNIKIVNKYASITNECVNSELLNTNSITKEYMIRVGTVVIAYVTDVN